MCLSPYDLKNPKYPQNPTAMATIAVPCQVCTDCINKHVRQWTQRALWEAKRHEYYGFLTLTYDSEHLPKSKLNGIPTLRYKDFADYMKRLRKATAKYHGESILTKYLVVGEYGSINRRPHWHALLYGFPTEIIMAEKNGANELWPAGMISYDQITPGRINYCLKYMQKAGGLPRRGQEKEARRQSTGFGSNYLEDEAILKWHREDINRTYFADSNEFITPLPKGWLDRIYTEKERREQKTIALQRMEEVDAKLKTEWFREYGHMANDYPFWKYKVHIRKGRFDKGQADLRDQIKKNRKDL